MKGICNYLQESLSFRKHRHLDKGGKNLYIGHGPEKQLEKKIMQLYMIIQSTEKSSVLGNQILSSPLISKNPSECWGRSEKNL